MKKIEVVKAKLNLLEEVERLEAVNLKNPSEQRTRLIEVLMQQVYELDELEELLDE